MSNPNNLPPTPVQSYRLSDDALARGVNGLTLSFAGCPMAQQEMFDVIAALALAGPPQVITVSETLVVGETVLVGQLEGPATFNVCDNAIKQALDAYPDVVRIG